MYRLRDGEQMRNWVLKLKLRFWEFQKSIMWKKFILKKTSKNHWRVGKISLNNKQNLERKSTKKGEEMVHPNFSKKLTVYLNSELKIRDTQK